MTQMKYGLKSIMSETSFEVIVFKLAKQEYQLVISELSLYNNDDQYHHEVDTFKLQKDAIKEMDSIITYMNENGFSKVKKRFSDIS